MNEKYIHVSVAGDTQRDGLYVIPLNADDTDTPGNLYVEICITDEHGENLAA